MLPRRRRTCGPECQLNKWRSSTGIKLRPHVWLINFYRKFLDFNRKFLDFNRKINVRWADWERRWVPTASKTLPTHCYSTGANEKQTKINTISENQCAVSWLRKVVSRPDLIGGELSWSVSWPDTLPLWPYFKHVKRQFFTSALYSVIFNQYYFYICSGR